MENLKNLEQQLLAYQETGLSPLEAVKKLKSGGLAASAALAAAPAIHPQVLATILSTIWKGITPLEMAQGLKAFDNDPEFVAKGLMSDEGFPDLTALQLGKILLDPTIFPNLSKEDMFMVLIAVNFTPDVAQAAITVLYNLTTSYALNLTGNPSYLTAPSNSVYNFGTFDFSLQAWVRTKGSGTVISRKSTQGGSGNGGFLLVIKNDSSIKFATDNGFGFYEINSVPSGINDDNWHFLTAVRRSNVLELYLDGKLIQSTPRSNISPPIDVNNNLPLMMGNVAQIQEPFRQFTGSIDEVRIWNRALSTTEILANMNKPLLGNEAGLIGYYTFSAQNGNDSSPTKNNATPIGSVSYVSPGAIS
ncbi:LamG domain-containing protein [Flavobacterium sp. RS13.1]|uniref:LamG domain-containing protein n=1 Tax=Flavobacterium sp. RS13.1 TaxID=3400345 RepID=UPI003AAC858A